MSEFITKQKIQFIGVYEVKTQTTIRKIMLKGEEVDRKLITRVTFESEIDPEAIAQLHRLLAVGQNINVDIYSLQLSMNLGEEK